MSYKLEIIIDIIFYLISFAIKFFVIGFALHLGWIFLSCFLKTTNGG